jgi:hypothetical protein
MKWVHIFNIWGRWKKGNDLSELEIFEAYTNLRDGDGKDKHQK